MFHSTHPIRNSPNTIELQQRGQKKIDWMNMVNRILMIAAVALFALTVVLLGFSQAGYFHPAYPLIAFSPIIPLFVLAGIVDCCRDSVAKRHGINLTAQDNMRLRRRSHNRN